MNEFLHPSPKHTDSHTIHEAILASSSSVRDSLPEQHREHFNTLRQEIIDFAKAHGIPKDALTKPNTLLEAAKKLSTPDLQQLALLLERFEYLLIHHEPKKEKLPEALEHAEKFYHLKEQYDSQVELLERTGILDHGAILGIDGNEYLVPTLEQIALRLFERRGELSVKHDQGFTKLLLVPFGMSLDTLRKTFTQFLLSYHREHSDFDLDINEPLATWKGYEGADIGDPPKFVYYPKFFDGRDHRGRTKMEILEGQTGKRYAPAYVGVVGESGTGISGWTIHLLQPSDPSNPDSKGIARISRQSQGQIRGKENPRPDLVADQTPREYLSILQEAKEDPYSPYSQESGMTPEDWIVAFITHLEETGRPMDNFYRSDGESRSFLVGAFHVSNAVVPDACWDSNFPRATLIFDGPERSAFFSGVRTSVII